LLTAVALATSASLPVARAATPPAPAPGCPTLDWTGGFHGLLQPGGAFPTQDTASLQAPDCAFHQWSWEAFVWATALVTDSASGATVPRFLTLATPEELLSSAPGAGKARLRPLKLAARSQKLHGTAGFTEGAGAIVEADGNMLVGQNGYPVYASVHMNESYFDTAQKNLIVNGGYQQQPADSHFSVGAAVFKATWMRLDASQPPPAGAYTTQAQVPVLQSTTSGGTTTIAPVPGQFATVTVALVGLHVVGYTVNHPEFLWGTFEHRLNSPQTADNSFSPSGSSATGYTFYAANTPYSQVNQSATPPLLTLNAQTQKLSPVTNVVLENMTGGENQPSGSGNIATLNADAQSALAKLAAPQSTFANYNLIGTVWMKPNTYNLKSDQRDAVGSINLANGTAETFVQTARNGDAKKNTNCFLCHNPTSYSFQKVPPKLANRLIALSHVLSIGTAYAVPNQVSGQAGSKPIDAARAPAAKAGAL
jgi:hypothetical protein